jgi:methyltransferase family protein
MARCGVAVQASTLELSAGNGLNFAHRPTEVTSVVAVEPKPYLRKMARRSSAAVPIEVVDGSRSTKATSLSRSSRLCSVRDQHAALHELYRVLRPGGEFRERFRARLGGARLRASDGMH